MSEQNASLSVELLARQLENVRRELGLVTDLAYYPGHTTCDKCGFTLVTKNLNPSNGAISTVNRDPGVCPNDGTPMRRTTERESNQQLEKAYGQLHDEYRVAKLALETIANLPLADQDDMPSANMRILAKKALQSIAEGVKNDDSH